MNLYLYHRESESIRIKSSRLYNTHTGVVSTAYCVLQLYPLRIRCHFMVTVPTPTTSSHPAYSADIVNDFFIVTDNKQSKISFYSLDDVVREHSFEKSVKLKEKVREKV